MHRDAVGRDIKRIDRFFVYGREGKCRLLPHLLPRLFLAGGDESSQRFGGTATAVRTHLYQRQLFDQFRTVRKAELTTHQRQQFV